MKILKTKILDFGNLKNSLEYEINKKKSGLMKFKHSYDLDIKKKLDFKN